MNFSVMQTLDSIKNNNRQNPDEIGKKIHTTSRNFTTKQEQHARTKMKIIEGKRKTLSQWSTRKASLLLRKQSKPHQHHKEQRSHEPS